MGHCFFWRGVKYYTRLRNKAPLFTSSMGRLIDAFAALLDLGDVQSYEGRSSHETGSTGMAGGKSERPRTISIFTIKGNDYWLSGVPNNGYWILMQQKMPKRWPYLWHSLAILILDQADHTNCHQIALSGGVFQNAYLVDALLERNKGRCRIFCTKSLSPNDENILWDNWRYTSWPKKKFNNKIKNSNTMC